MGVFDLIRAIFGLNSSETTQRTDVSAGSGSDDEPAGSEPTTAETDESVAAGTDATASRGSMTETPSEDPEAVAEPDAPSADDVADDPVDSISGIGQAYAGRLAEADIETVGELLEADAAELSGRTDLSEKRIRRWQENAGED
jgi:predicted flap endonuclease-1-like 5' DNA nuclease